MLESFRLPGESQQIERIMETFSITYFETGPGMITVLCLKISFFKRRKYNNCFTTKIFIADIETQTATFVLAYSIIMLNTDLHNPQVRV